MSDLTQIKCFRFNGQHLNVLEVKEIYSEFRRYLNDHTAQQLADKIGVRRSQIYHFIKVHKKWFYMKPSELEHALSQRIKFRPALEDMPQFIPQKHTLNSVACAKW